MRKAAFTKKVWKSLRVVNENEEDTKHPSSNGPETQRFVDMPELTERDWRVLVSVAQEICRKQGDLIIDEREYNETLYRVKEGRVRVEKTELLSKGTDSNSNENENENDNNNSTNSQEFKKTTLTMIEEGGIFGEISLLNLSGTTRYSPSYQSLIPRGTDFGF